MVYYMCDLYFSNAFYNVMGTIENSLERNIIHSLYYKMNAV